MRKKVLLALVMAVFLLSFALTGCQSGGGGISQELYDKVVAQFNEAQEKINEARDNIDKMEAERDAIMAELKDTKSKIGELEGLVNSLKEQYELVGATPAETAENIVKYYYDTHEYSMTDYFICSDMAGEVWNMLKAHGINARIAIGNTDNSITDILQCNHAWVLAEVAPGEYLALETTGGYAVPESQNVLYYRGWYFNSPADLKKHNNLVREYNIKIGFHNTLAAEDREVVEEHNQSTSPQVAEKLEAVHNKLVELIEQQQADLNNLMTEINSLATRCDT